MKTPTTIETPKIANSVIDCDACKWLQRFLNASFFAKLDLVERKQVHAVQMANFKILPGAPYIEETGTAYGKPYKSRYIKEIHLLCEKYELYSYVGDNKPKLN